MVRVQKTGVVDDQNDGFRGKMVAVNRVTKVVKGGRVLAFAALAVVGDGKGQIGMGRGKAREVPLAVQKAMSRARRHLVKVSLKDASLQYPIVSRYGASTVRIAPAKKGTGVIAGGTLRAVFEVMGVRNVVAKSHGSTNPYNLLRATLEGLRTMSTPGEIAAKRGKSVREIIS